MKTMEEATYHEGESLATHVPRMGPQVFVWLFKRLAPCLWSTHHPPHHHTQWFSVVAMDIGQTFSPPEVGGLVVDWCGCLSYWLEPQPSSCKAWQRSIFLSYNFLWTLTFDWCCLVHVSINFFDGSSSDFFGTPPHPAPPPTLPHNLHHTPLFICLHNWKYSLILLFKVIFIIESTMP